MRRTRRNPSIFLGSLGRLLEGDGLLLAHGADDGDKEILALLKAGRDLLAKLAFRDSNVVLGIAILVHQVEETIVDIDLMRRSRVSQPSKCCLKPKDTHELVFITADVGDIHVVGRGRDIFLLTEQGEIRRLREVIIA
jgi:hypothetical protein